MHSKRNSYGLYDSPIQRHQGEVNTVTQEEYENMLAQGAFVLPYEEAVEKGFLRSGEVLDTLFLKEVNG